MLNVPINFGVPMLNGGFAAAVDWPALGAVLAWFLVLCLLGVTAGVLREFRRLPSVPPDNHAGKPAETRLHVLHKHLKAA